MISVCFYYGLLHYYNYYFWVFLYTQFIVFGFKAMRVMGLVVMMKHYVCAIWQSTTTSGALQPQPRALEHSRRQKICVRRDVWSVDGGPPIIDPKSLNSIHFTYIITYILGNSSGDVFFVFVFNIQNLKHLTILYKMVKMHLQYSI